MKKEAKILRYKDTKKQFLELPKKFQAWIGNRGALVRILEKPMAHRSAARWGAPAGVALIVLLAFTSLLFPKNEIQKAKERLAKNPNDIEAAISLANKFLENNQYQEAGKILSLAQRNRELGTFVLGEKTSAKLEDLQQRKQYSDPKDIQRLITAWEEIMAQKPSYRDGWLELAFLHYKIFEDEKAKECLNKALEIDPNCEPAKEFEKLFQ
jgi:tetratricopeptide (TPR) repeat protein